MKREYSKPTIHVEIMCLDMPIAASCQDVSESFELRTQGWFISGTDSNCIFIFDKDNGDNSFMDEVGDTLCYHSHTGTTLYS